MKETLKIMSLNRWSYALSYFITQGVFAVFTGVMVFIGFWGTFTSDGKSTRQDLTLFFGLILFGLNCVSQTMAMSTLFTDSKIATYAGIMVMFIPTNILFYTFITMIQKSVTSVIEIKPYHGEQWFELLYIFPHFSFGRILLEYLIDDGANKLLFKLLLPLPLENAWYAAVFTTVFYFLLYMYLDAIIPNAYGIAQPCCFCCKRRNKSKFA